VVYFIKEKTLDLLHWAIALLNEKIKKIEEEERKIDAIIEAAKKAMADDVGDVDVGDMDGDVFPRPPIGTGDNRDRKE
jgi:hypothetical protein